MTKSYQVISVNQLVSPTPSIIKTHKLNPIMIRYVEYNVFVDHYSDFTNVHLIFKRNAESTVKSELVFERVYD